MIAGSRSRRPGCGLLALAVIAVIVLVVTGGLPSLNPFATEQVDRSQPAILRSIDDLGELRAASANLQVVVDVEQDVKNVPSFLKGERVLLVAAGQVDAGVDLSKLDAGDIDVSGDRRSVTISLPRAALGPARLDQSRTRVYSRERGLIDRLGDLTSDNPVDDQAIYVLAEKRLQAAAAAEPDLLDRAESNTRMTLTGLLRGLGFRNVTIRFVGTRPGL